MINKGTRRAGASITALCTQTSVLFCQDRRLPGVSLGSASSNPCGFSVSVCVAPPRARARASLVCLCANYLLRASSDGGEQLQKVIFKPQDLRNSCSSLDTNGSIETHRVTWTAAEDGGRLATTCGRRGSAARLIRVQYSRRIERQNC